MSSTMVVDEGATWEILLVDSWRTMMAMMREKNIAKAFTTPWMSVIVTMSPFCDVRDFVTEHPLHLVTAHRAEQARRHGDQARRLLGPVAKALTSADS